MRRHYRWSRSCAIALSLGWVAVFAGTAQAATKSAYIFISSYPAGLYGTTDKSTGAFDGYYSSSPSVPQRTVQLRGGAIIADSSTTTPISVAPGDVFQLRNTNTDAVLAETTFSGPALDPTTCIGQNGFSGTRANDADVTVQTTGPFSQEGGYGRSFSRKQVGHVRSLGVGTFSGVFDTAIGASDYLWVTQDLESTADDTDRSFYTTVVTVPGTCPPPPPVVPDTTPAKVLSFDLGTSELSVKAFLRSGLSTFIGLDEPAAISAELYIDGANVPLIAAAAKLKKCKAGYVRKVFKVKKGKKTIKVVRCVKSKKKATAIGKGSTRSTVAGVIKVLVKATATARKALKGKKSFKVVLVTTVRDAAGNVTQVPKKRLTLVK